MVCTSKDLSAAPPSATLEGCAANVFACFQCWKSCNDTTSEVAWQIDPHTCARAHARTPMGERVQAHARDRGSIALTLLAVAEIRRVKSRRASTGRSASKVRRGEARPGKLGESCLLERIESFLDRVVYTIVIKLPRSAKHSIINTEGLMLRCSFN